MQKNNDTDYAGKTNPISAIKLPGQRYRAIRKLGAGSMGEVYLAEDTKLHRRVAIKSIRADRTAADQILRRIKRECLLHARIGAHPHIVTLFDLHDDGDRLFLVMEYVDGDTLEHVLAAHRKEGRPFPIGDGVDIAIQCLRGLAHVHARGIIHRDIKPANVMLTRDSDGNYTAKIMDFGVARQEEQDPDATTLTHPGSRSPGTPLYMAPEQIDSATYGPVVPASDLYAVGVLLYQLITGQPPFTGSLTDVFNGHLNADPRPMRRPNGAEPHPLLAEAIDRALLKHAHLRFASAAEFAAELESIRFLVTTGQRSDESNSESVLANAWHSSLTRWAFAGLAGLVIAGAAFVGYRELPSVRLAWERLGLDGLIASPAAPKGTPASTDANLPEVHAGEKIDGTVGKPAKPVRTPVRPEPLKDTSTPSAKTSPAPTPTPAPAARTPEIIPPKTKTTPEIIPPVTAPAQETTPPASAVVPLQAPAPAPVPAPVPAPDAAVAPAPAPVLDDTVIGGDLFNVTPESAPAASPLPAPAPAVTSAPPAPTDAASANVNLEAAEVPMVMEAAEVVSLGEPQVHPIDEEVGLEPVASATPAPPKPDAAPPEAPKDAEAGTRTYRVLQGDTLDGIAKQFGLTVEDLTRWNQLRSASDIRPEQVLFLYERPGLAPPPPPAFDLEGADSGRKESKSKEIIRKTKGMIKGLID